MKGTLVHRFRDSLLGQHGNIVELESAVLTWQTHKCWLSSQSICFLTIYILAATGLQSTWLSTQFYIVPITPLLADWDSEKVFADGPSVTLPTIKERTLLVKLLHRLMELKLCMIHWLSDPEPALNRSTSGNMICLFHTTKPKFYNKIVWWIIWIWIGWWQELIWPLTSSLTECSC